MKWTKNYIYHKKLLHDRVSPKLRLYSFLFTIFVTLYYFSGLTWNWHVHFRRHLIALWRNKNKMRMWGAIIIMTIMLRGNSKNNKCRKELWNSTWKEQKQSRNNSWRRRNSIASNRNQLLTRCFVKLQSRENWIKNKQHHGLAQFWINQRRARQQSSG